MKQSFFKVLLLLLITVSCKKDYDVQPSDIGLNYFPVAIGNYWIYKVTNLNLVYGKTVPDTAYYDQKEVVSDTFYDGSGQLAYKLQIFLRNVRSSIVQPYDTGAAWVIDSVFNFRINNTQLIVFESNTPHVKLVFPLSEGETWDGNQYNSDGPDFYTVKRLDLPDTLPSKQVFPRTLNVSQQNDTTLLSLYYANEVYARDVGLIERVSTTSLDACNFATGGQICTPPSYPVVYSYYIKYMTQYGKE